MAVLQLCLRVSDGARPRFPVLKIEIQRVVGDEIAAEIAAVSDVTGKNDGYAPSAGGILSDMKVRSGRSVVAWSARIAGLPVGVATLAAVAGRAGPRYSIATLLVARDHRRRGVGTALVAEAVAHARTQGAREVWVETSAAWPAAEAFWRSSGFRLRQTAP